ncbi:hypothetical protein [Nocardiopsis dassonvillei]|uniref:hypothetical protein n=1 Tax=Nocardiopsis dassonvillei TaxID=2014 RepID=UPI00157D235D|nr:hypothetical protein [Nocardiopsis dassonvillei]
MTPSADRPQPHEDTTPHSSVIQPVRLRRGDRAITVIEPRQAPAQYDFLGGSFRQMASALGQIAVEYDLSKRQCHLILMLAGKQERGGLIKMTQAEMAKEMRSKSQPEGWDRTDVSKMLTQLRKIGLIYAVPGKRGQYRFRPEVIFHGTSAEQQAAIAEMPESVPELRLSAQGRKSQP